MISSDFEQMLYQTQPSDQQDTESLDKLQTYVSDCSNVLAA